MQAAPLPILLEEQKLFHSALLPDSHLHLWCSLAMCVHLSFLGSSLFCVSPGQGKSETVYEVELHEVASCAQSPPASEGRR